MKTLIAVLAASSALLFTQTAAADRPERAYVKPNTNLDIQIVVGEPRERWVPVYRGWPYGDDGRRYPKRGDWDDDDWDDWDDDDWDDDDDD